jgi:predicted extracellular nuclease
VKFARWLGVLTLVVLLVTRLAPTPALAAPTELFFSEYVEGSSNNKALEIYNGTGSAVTLTSIYQIQVCFNGATSCSSFPLTGSVANGDVFVFASSTAAAAILAQADQTTAASLFNGDDAIVLRKSGVIVDVIGQIGFDPGTEWGSGLTSTADNTLRRKSAITAGDTNGSNAFDPSVEWDGYATDTFDGLGSHNSGLRIRDIQGASHISPKNGQTVQNIPGIVTALRSTGFYLQDSTSDSNPATSEGIFVFRSSNTAPVVAVGDAVLVGGTVTEFRPGGTGGTTNLTITEIGGTVSVTVQSHSNPLPAATVIGTGGRVPPTTVIDDDATGDVETSGTFDATSDGIDFYESMESMRVQINSPVVVGPTNANGEVVVLGDNGANASIRTTRGGIVVRSNDFNPERITLDDLFQTMPQLNVGDHFTGAVVGILDYAFGNFHLQPTSTLTTTAGGLAQEITTAPSSGQLSVATFNVENLDPGDGAAKFNTLASLLVTNLKSPDLVAVEEIQDNNGATNDAVVDAATTYNTLIAAITTAGGPTYQYRQINPVDDQDGGEPGGNIRQGFLFRTDRGLSFIDRAGGTSTAATTIVNSGGSPQLSFSPGRIDPTNAAFSSSRKPLAGEFSFNGRKFFAIANHFNSKGGDQPLFGHFQPPTLSSATQRTQQAQIVNNFVDAILAINANANIIVMGDLNDFEFSAPLTTLKGGVLTDLVDGLAQAERYTYEFEGNAQALDHILVSSNINLNAAPLYDVVHVNAEFATQASDHDPSVVRMTLP